MSNNTFKIVEHFSDENFETLMSEYILMHLKKLLKENEIEKSKCYNNNETTTNYRERVIGK